MPGATVAQVYGVLHYMLSDYLGSASVVLDASGAVVAEQRYYPFGEAPADGHLPHRPAVHRAAVPARLGLDHFAQRCIPRQ